MKVKEFVKEHEKVVRAIGIGAVVVASGLICYQGKRMYNFAKVGKIVSKRKDMQDMIALAMKSEGTYGHILDADEIVKFKDLGKLAKVAVEFPPSALHLEDNVTGMFVCVKP